MRRFTIFFMCLFLIFSVSEIDARRSGGSFRSSSSRRSSSFSTKRSSVPRKTTTSRKSTKKSTVKKTTNKNKQKAVSKNKLDRKQKKALVAKDKQAFKKYKNKKEATTAYKKELASKNKYDKPTPPKERPKHIPQNVTINNQQVNVSYGGFPGGGYGYGYMDPITNAFVTLAITDMIVDSHMMRQAGYGSWQANGMPHREYIGPPAGVIFLSIFGSIVGLVVVIIIIKTIFF